MKKQTKNRDHMYYLTRKAKLTVNAVRKKRTQRVLWINPEEVNEVNENKYVKSLVNDYGFGIQLTNPMFVMAAQQ